jgi:thiol:disulfide interchange protein DsbD
VLVHDGIPFALDVDRAITLAKSRQQPLFFDFTGVNCVNCRLMEQKMKEPDNHSRLERFLATQLFADRVPHITDAKYADSLLERNIDLQVKWFGDVSLPAYAVVTPDGKKILAVYKGLERKDGEFAAFLDKGWDRFEQWKSKKLAAGQAAAVTVK